MADPPAATCALAESRAARAASSVAFGEKSRAASASVRTKSASAFTSDAFVGVELGPRLVRCRLGGLDLCVESFELAFCVASFAAA